MVSTRRHPREFPPPTTPRTPHTTNRTTHSDSPSDSDELSPSAMTIPSSSVASAPKQSAPKQWSHTPSQLTLYWLLISLPLVMWDTGYVLLRPHTMPGGALHYPIWSPYELYGRVDHFYGWPAWEANDGFTGAQGLLNAVETAGYLYYLWIVYTKGELAPKVKGRGAPTKGSAVGNVLGWWGLTMAREVEGRDGAIAVLVAFAVAIMTLSKTVLYWLCELCSGFKEVGHNTPFNLFWLWIVPNGLWLIFPTYMIYIFAKEIAQGLEASGGVANSKKSK